MLFKGALAHTGCPNLEVLRRVTPRPALMKRLAKVKPPLKYIRIDIGNGKIPNEEGISALSAFHSLRAIEIECAHIEDQDLEQVVKFASEVLRKFAREIPVRKNWNLRRITRNARLNNPGSTNPEPKLVRILRYRSRPTPIYNQTPLDPVPVRIEVFVVQD
ncbi:hypothetical protein OPQ81_010333 [Rhizoctonia solani]|nr:hypothetical protein OPQ81_010333 [Rhizoctonia solani]